MVYVERFLFGHGILDSCWRGIVGSLRSHGTRLSLARQSNPCLVRGRAKVERSWIIVKFLI